MFAPDTILLDRYQITSLLGKGGMGAVYQAIDRKFGSTVAIKEMLVSGDELLRAFEREARLLNKLRHGALPVVMDYFTEGTRQFLVMQYIPGDDLATLLARNGNAFAPEVVLRWAEQLLDVLSYLHEHEPPVIHRDIKPQNLKLTPRGEVILLDFGLSKSAALKNATLTGTTSVSVLGYTPHYAPFEQINGVGTDPRSDLFSLAATLYHLMTGVLPPDAMTRAQSVMSGQTDPLRPADEVNPAIAPAVAAVLHDAMAMNREQRPASAVALRKALREAQQAQAWNAVSPTKMGAATVLTPSSSYGSTSSAPTITPDSGASAAPTYQPDTQGIEAPTSAATVAPHGKRSWLRPALVGALVMVVLVGGGFWMSRSPRATPAETKIPAASSELPAMVTVAPPEASFRFETLILDADGKVKERRTQQGRFYKEDLASGVSIDMVAIPAGTYMMGTIESSQADYEDEHPPHQVTLKHFYMSRFEVTQAQWRAVAQGLPKVTRDLNPDPSQFKGDNLPVENVSWEEANEFCERLTRKAKRLYRLPSEAEWEYAARGGTTTAYAFGETITPEFVNYDGTAPYGAGPKGVSRGQTVPVGSLGVANAYGLYDMHGNVWEWGAGEYHDTYRGAPPDGRPWIIGGDVERRVVRGGSWNNLAIDCRSANRYSYAQDGHNNDIGFRLAMSLTPNQL